MTTPNLDALGHHWVNALANFQMSIEYVRGIDNKVADALSRVKERLPPEAVKQLIDFARINTPVERAESDNPSLIKEVESLDQEVIIQSRVLLARRQIPKNVSAAYWIKLQRNDNIIKHVINWMHRLTEDQRKLSNYLKGKVSDDVRHLYGKHQNDLVMSHGMLYMKSITLNARDVTFAFVVPSY